MKFSNLNQDLKNFDVQNIIEDFKSRKEVVLRSVLIASAIIGAFFAYSNRDAEVARLKRQVPLLEEKTRAIESFKKSETERKNFLEDFPKVLDEDELKDFVTDLAGKYHMRIQSMSSIERSSDKYYERVSFSINFTAMDFIELVLFVHEIEASGYALRVESWSGQMQEQFSRTKQGATEGPKPIESQIKITALKIKK